MDHLGAAARYDLEHPWVETRARRVVAHHRLPERVDGVRPHEVDRAATEPGAGQAGADDARRGRGGLDQRIELRAADAEQVAHRGMARIEQATDLVEVALLERR